MRNPQWHRDEIILALDLYFRLEPGQIHARNSEVIKLSEIINKLPIHEIRPDIKTFRNPNGVGLKLSNFLAIDPNYHGKGMKSYSKLDKEIFEEFVNDKTILIEIANNIKKIINNDNVNRKLYQIPVDCHDNYSVREGQVIYKLHKYRERDSKITQQKKRVQLKKNGQLKCEVCDFDFYLAYGELGFGFIECHHLIPLSEVASIAETTIDNLALVCANCHRMLHRKIDTLTITELKKICNVTKKAKMHQ